MQAQVDGMGAGSVVHIPKCICRQSVVVNKALTLVGQPGAEIWGSDIWDNWL